MNLGDGSPLSPISSATVLMLRDAPRGLEVFVVKRHGLSDVLGGAYVFPGGKVDRRDAIFVDRLDQVSDTLRDALGEPELTGAEAGALYVAAIREVYEEAGVLFASSEDGWALVPPLSCLGCRFEEVLDTPGVRLAAASLVPWCRWITPLASVRARKHFDARFFVATVPVGQEPVHDQHEVTESLWLTPRSALQAYWEGRIELAAPQIMSLSLLARHRDVHSVLTEARLRKPLRIHPEVFEQDGVQLVCYPGDALHSVRLQVMPGPTRLCWRNNRYEPQDGLESLFR